MIFKALYEQDQNFYDVMEPLIIEEVPPVKHKAQDHNPN